MHIEFMQRELYDETGLMQVLAAAGNEAMEIRWVDGVA